MCFISSLYRRFNHGWTRMAGAGLKELTYAARSPNLSGVAVGLSGRRWQAFPPVVHGDFRIATSVQPKNKFNQMINRHVLTFAKNIVSLAAVALVAVSCTTEKGPV